MRFDLSPHLTEVPSPAALQASHGRDWEVAARIARRTVRRNRLSEAQNHRCCHCLRTTDPNSGDEGLRPTIEHVVPRSRNGLDWSGNVVMACADCNSDRGDRPVPEEGLVLGERCTEVGAYVPRWRVVSRDPRVASSSKRRGSLGDATPGGACANRRPGI